jgi:hypothetical protein
MTHRILDSGTQQQIQRLLAEARRNGIAPVDALARSRLILDPQRRKDIELEALQELLRDLTKWRPTEYARRVSKNDPISPAQMLETVLEYVSEYIDQKAKS